MSGAADDGGLLRRYAEEGDEGAFASVVGRHVDWVYSAALRRVRDPGMAEDVTQATFLMMAKRAGKLSGHVSVAGWLFRVMSFGVRAAMRKERVRKVHEMRAMEMKMDAALEEKCWSEMERKLEGAVEKLGSGDREAILLRFYQRMSFGEMGAVLGVGEDAARKRVTRAVGKLRERLGGEAEAGVLAAVLLERVVSVAPATLRIGAAGVHGGGVLAIFEGVKAMMMTAKMKLAAAVVAVVLIPVAVGGVMLAVRGDGAAATTTAGGIVLSKETTGITGPLHADGTPDYVAAINAKYSAGVTPENNAFTAWMELVGSNPNVFDTKTREEVFRMAGVKEFQKVVFQQYYDYLNAHGIKDLANENTQDDEITAYQRIWTEKELPTLATYLKENAEGLDAMAGVWGRERYWQPWVAMDGRSMISVLLPSLGQARATASALLARGTLRMGQGDFKRFLADVLTAERIGHHLENCPAMIERMVGISIEQAADKSIGAVAGSGVLNAEQCKEVERMLEELPATNAVEAVDVDERWNMLDMMFLAQRGNSEMFEGDLNKTNKSVKALDRAAVNWNEVLKKVNRTMDELVDADGRPTVDEVNAAAKQVYARFPDVKIETLSLAREPDESKEAYTERIGDTLLGTLLPHVNRAEVMHREAVMRRACAELVVAAGQYRAEKGKWPEELSDLAPGYVKRVPEDLYVPGEMVRYWKGEEGIWVYSVGPNRRDEAGRGYVDGGDDVGVGVYRAGKMKLDAPAPYLSREDNAGEGIPFIIR